jgi:hypothetical protein
VAGWGINEAGVEGRVHWVGGGHGVGNVPVGASRSGDKLEPKK